MEFVVQIKMISTILKKRQLELDFIKQIYNLNPDIKQPKRQRKRDTKKVISISD